MVVGFHSVTVEKPLVSTVLTVGEQVVREAVALLDQLP